MFEMSLQTLQWFPWHSRKVLTVACTASHTPPPTHSSELNSCNALHHPFSATEASLLVLHCIRHPPPQKLLLTSFRVILKHFIHSNCSPFPPPFSSFILPFMACHIACTLSSPSLSYDHMLLPPECKLCEDARFCVAALVYLSSCSPGV